QIATASQRNTDRVGRAEASAGATAATASAAKATTTATAATNAATAKGSISTGLGKVSDPIGVSSGVPVVKTFSNIGSAGFAIRIRDVETRVAQIHGLTGRSRDRR